MTNSNKPAPAAVGEAIGRAYAAYCAHGITPPITRVGERIEHAFGAGWEAALSQGSGIEDDTPAPAEVEDMVGRLRHLSSQPVPCYSVGHALKRAADMLAALSRNQGGGR